MQLIVRNQDFFKKLTAIAVPIALQNLISFGVNMADTVMVGRLGEEYLSGVALANQFNSVFMILIFGIASGSNVMVAQYWSKRDRASIHSVMTIMYRLVAVSVLVFSYLAIFQAELVMSAFTKDTAVIEQGAAYFRIIGYTYLPAGFVSATTIMLRAVGSVKIALVVSVSTLATNVFLNWVLIFGNMGAPAMGVRGAAIATLCARVLELIIVLVYYIKFEKKLCYKIRHLFIKKVGLMRLYTKTAMPVVLNELIWAVGAALIAVCIGRMGRELTAANSICQVLGQLVTVFIFGVANASAVVVGNAVGAGEYEKAREYAKILGWLSVLLGVIAAGVVLLLKNPMISFYNISQEAQAYAHQIITVNAVIVFAQSFAAISLMGILRGGGDTRFVLLMDVLFMWVISIPLGFISGLLFEWPVVVVYAIIKSDEWLKSFFSLKRIISGKWINDITTAAGLERGEVVQNKLN